MTGKGTFYFANGDTYEGDFVDSEKHGEGPYTMPMVINTKENGNMIRKMVRVFLLG